MSKAIRNVLLIIACVVIIVGGIGGYFVYATYFEDEEPDTNITDSTNKEHEDIVEDENFNIYNSNGEKLTRISSAQFNAGSIQQYRVTKAYKIDIIPNTTITASNFTFKVNNQTKNFKDELTLLKGFTVIQNEDNTFTLDLSNGANLKNVLEKLYGSPVQVNTADVLKQDKIFTIIIRAQGSNDVRYIDFGLNTQLVYLSAESIVIG